jgi:hypothetical protein
MAHAASHPDDFERPRTRACAITPPRLDAALLALAFALVPANAAAAGVAMQTVCTITVNSADEKEALRRHLPADRFRFVELVEKGRPDWLASARKQNLRCDVLVISGHFDGGIDGGNEFFSEQVEAREFLPVAEMERASCSADDHGIFANLKEVYLFGCNTLNPESFRNGVGEIERSLMRSGQTRADAARIARALAARHGDGSRDRMRQIFPTSPRSTASRRWRRSDRRRDRCSPVTSRPAAPPNSARGARASGCSRTSARRRSRSPAASARAIRSCRIARISAASPTSAGAPPRSSHSCRTCSRATPPKCDCSSTGSKHWKAS